MTVASALQLVREKIEAAVVRRGPGQPVRLVGVSKKQPASAVAQAAAAGLLDFGENYGQELRDKRAALTELDVRWHFIGPLQTNKVKYVTGIHLVHTVDRLALLTALEDRAARDGVELDVLVQVNVAHEAGKSGIAPEDLDDLLARFADCGHLRCRGLMLIPPLGEPEATRPHFAALRRLRDALAGRARPRVDLRELSMGMSSDYEVAIDEGATLVRVGTAIFGQRP